MNTKNLILSMIKDDLINATLIQSLDDIGIDASNYSIHARDTVLQLMGFEEGAETEPIRDFYTDLTKLATYYVDHKTQRKAFQQLASDIFAYLNSVCPQALYYSNRPIIETALRWRRLILDLIRQDLICYRWTRLLHSAELAMSDSYTMNLDRIIFDELELEEHPDIDTIYDGYMKRLERIMEVEDLDEALTVLAVETFEYLERCRAMNVE